MNQPKGAVVFIILRLNTFFKKEQTVSNNKSLTQIYSVFTGATEGFDANLK